MSDRASRIVESVNDGLTLVHVPTVQELHREGLARLNPASRAGGSTSYTLTDEGQARIYAAMRANAERGRELDARRQRSRLAERVAQRRARDWAADAFTE